MLWRAIIIGYSGQIAPIYLFKGQCCEKNNVGFNTWDRQDKMMGPREKAMRPKERCFQVPKGNRSE